MEIVIKTAEEFWRDKVSIQISGTADEVQTVGQHLVRGRQATYWADACEKAEAQVRDLFQQVATAQQAREIETRRAEELAEKVRLYDVDRKTERDRADRTQARNLGLAGRVASLESDLTRYRRAHVCTDRCDEDAHVAFEGNRLVKDLETELAAERAQSRDLRAELERRFTVEQVADAKDGARADERARLDREVIKPLNEKLTRIHAAVLGTELARQIAEHRRDDTAMSMVEALTEVRRITGVTSV